ncbi:tyrosine--tRNA ligase [Buchnera aphidicola]|uniref:tyrosine--tRNA ligase n=1 Tax=Buchnera aphidicola TaxID=9 RepID=UPI003463BD72
MVTFDFIHELRNRCLISHVSNEEQLQDIIKNQSIAFYCGFDPTADSLHIGHLLLLITLKRLQKYGHKPIVLVGGGTSLIGDPSFKEKERLSDINNNVDKWTQKIIKQISFFLDFNCGMNSALILNNNIWLKKLDLLSFLRNIGKHFSINTMINRDSVKQRIIRTDQGISFTEFSYSLLQAYDFFILNKKYQVILQIGGSDQWGNISSGMHLINRLSQKDVYGLTIPLLVQSNGIKFGKTESGTIWLDAKKTSPYKFYQFWINIDDNSVYYFLKLFTFEELSIIELLEKENNINNQIIKDKLFLAKTITRLVHGKENLLAVERITEVLFSRKIHCITESDFQQLEQDGIPSITAYQIKDLQDALILCNFSKSRTQSKNLIQANAISVNTQKIINLNYIFSTNDKLFKKFTLLSKGKKHHSLICWKNF